MSRKNNVELIVVIIFTILVITYLLKIYHIGRLIYILMGSVALNSVMLFRRRPTVTTLIWIIFQFTLHSVYGLYMFRKVWIEVSTYGYGVWGLWSVLFLILLMICPIGLMTLLIGELEWYKYKKQKGI